MPPQPLGSERLGTRGTEFPPPSATGGGKTTLTREKVQDKLAEIRAEERRQERFANRRLLWKLSGEKSVQCCGRGVVDSAAGVTIKTRGDKAYASGVTRCGAIWIDPVCSAKIRAERATEIGAAVAAHIEAGGTAYMVTLTVQHHKRHALGDLMDALSEAFSALTSGAQWAGDRKRGREGERARMGVLGFIRSTEVTVGVRRNGWHPHIHLILLMGARQTPRPQIPRKADRPADWVKPTWNPTPVGYFAVPDPSWDRTHMADNQLQVVRDFERMQQRWERVWEAWTAKHGFRAKKHGIKWDRIKTVQDAENLGEYLAKTQDGKNVGQEIARGDLKAGKDVGQSISNMTPFELLTRYRQLRDMTADEMDGLAKAGMDVGKELGIIAKLWAEYEKATKHRRAIEWSRDLRPALGLGEEKADVDIVEEDEHGEDTAHLDAPTWAKVCRLGMDYRVLRAVERGGLAELAVLLAAVGLTAESPQQRKQYARAQHGRVVRPPQN